MLNHFSPKRPALRPIGPSIAYLQSKCGTLFSLIDAADADFAERWCWKFSFKKSTKSHYLERSEHLPKGKMTTVSLASLLIGKAPEGFQIDHANGVSLDNRRANLRFANLSQQHQNQRTSSVNTSGHKGVSWVKNRGYYEVYINKNHQRTRLGFTPDLSKAIEMRLSAEIEMFGEFSRMVR